VIRDVPGHELPPEAWTRLFNVRCRKGNAERALGEVAVFGTPAVTPYFVFNVPGPNGQTFWFYFSLAKAYVFESATTTEVTNTGGDYNAAEGRDWNATLFGGIPIFNNREDIPQWWPALTSAQELEDLPNWPATTRAKVIRAFGSYLFALNITENTTQRPNAVLVSHKADPGSVPSSWDYTDDTVDAILFELVGGGEILDGLPLGSSFIVYKQSSTHIIRFIGGADLWGRDLLFTNNGILATRCVCEFDRGTKHFVVTSNDIIIHAGSKETLKPAEGKNRDAIFEELDVTNAPNSFVFENTKNNEVWFCYPTVGNTYPNRAFVYNYSNGTQWFRDLNAFTYAASGAITEGVADTWASDLETWDQDTTLWSTAGLDGIITCSPTAVAIYKLDSGFSFAAAGAEVVLEREGLAIIGRDRQGQPKVDYGVRKLVTRVWPKLRGGTWLVELGYAEDGDSATTWSASGTFDSEDDTYIDLVVNGRLVGIRFTQQDEVAGKLEGYDLRMALLGEF